MQGLLLFVQEDNEILKMYDIIAVRTSNESIFGKLCTSYPVASSLPIWWPRPPGQQFIDVIAFDVGRKLDFIPKKGIMLEAVRKEIMFEICYSPFIASSAARRAALSNAVLIGKLARGKNIIFSSGTSDKLFHRTPFEIESLYVSLLSSFELRSKQAEALWSSSTRPKWSSLSWKIRKSQSKRHCTANHSKGPSAPSTLNPKKAQKELKDSKKEKSRITRKKPKRLIPFWERLWNNPIQPFSQNEN